MKVLVNLYDIMYIMYIHYDSMYIMYVHYDSRYINSITCLKYDMNYNTNMT